MTTNSSDDSTSIHTLTPVSRPSFPKRNWQRVKRRFSALNVRSSFQSNSSSIGEFHSVPYESTCALSGNPTLPIDEYTSASQSDRESHPDPPRKHISPEDYDAWWESFQSHMTKSMPSSRSQGAKVLCQRLSIAWENEANRKQLVEGGAARVWSMGLEYGVTKGVEELEQNLSKG